MRIAPGLAKQLLAFGLVAASTGCGAGASTPQGAPGAVPTTVAISVGNPGRPVSLPESGSSLLLPYLQRMVDPLEVDYPNINLAPSGGGSGKGASDAISGAVVLGASDAYLSDGQAAQSPEILNIPIAVSAQAIDYDLPGVKDLRLTGDVIARIYEGNLTRWNDPLIAALNPGVSLPAIPIVPVRRVDASGDTFIFTSLLSATNADWEDGPAFSTTVTWPSVQGELTANGNAAMVQVCEQAPGCIAYVGVSAEQAALAAGLGEAWLRNRAGNFLTPTPSTIEAVLAARATSIPDDLRSSLIYADGARSYPIVNYEYLLVRSQQADADTALAVRSFLAWAIDRSKGSTAANLQSVGFVALPPGAVPRVRAAIARVTS